MKGIVCRAQKWDRHFCLSHGFLFKKQQSAEGADVSAPYFFAYLSTFDFLFVTEGFDGIEAGGFTGGTDVKKRKPELKAPASGPLDCGWGCEYITA